MRSPSTNEIMLEPDAPCPRILVVDDEAAMTKVLCDILTEQGYETVGLSTGTAALEALRESGFDLLLADMNMHGMDGIALLQAALKIDPNLVSVIMNGKGT